MLCKPQTSDIPRTIRGQGALGSKYTKGPGGLRRLKLLNVPGSCRIPRGPEGHRASRIPGPKIPGSSRTLRGKKELNQRDSKKNGCF